MINRFRLITPEGKKGAVRSIRDWMESLADAEWATKTNCSYLMDGAVFQQSTGRFDKNGVEIFEGDRVRYLEQSVRAYPKEDLVEWSEHYAGWLPFAAQVQNCGDDYYDWHMREIEVI